MKKMILPLLLIIVATISFVLGWWANEIFQFAKGVQEDSQRLNNAKMSNPFRTEDTYHAQMTSTRFYSRDNVTGGFSSITLILDRTGNLYLLDSIAVNKGETIAGSIYEWQGDTTARGYWCIIDNLIFCRFLKDKGFALKTFLLSKNISKSLSLRDNPEVVVFPYDLDTLFINGVPCVQK